MKNRVWLPLVILVLVLNAALPASALAVEQTVAHFEPDYSQSTIRFKGTHAGNAFEGTFQQWKADIRFDAANLAESQFRVTIETASAHTGNKMYDGTLPTEDWFDVKNHPQAMFESQSITLLAEGKYRVEGKLTLRNFTEPVAFDFALIPADGKAEKVEATASLALNRLLFGIGKKSDAKAEWVSEEIGLEIKLVANRQVD
jgi:cytochrome b561